MILVIGGAFQGQKDFAVRELGVLEEQIFDNFQAAVRSWLEEGADVEKKTDELLHSDYEAIVSDEVGLGIVPIEKADREWREAVGRALCKIAEASSSVYRVSCGIGMQIK